MHRNKMLLHESKHAEIKTEYKSLRFHLIFRSEHGEAPAFDLQFPIADQDEHTYPSLAKWQKKSGDLQGSNVCSCFTIDPKDSQVLFFIKLYQLTVVYGSDSENSLNG